MANSYTQILIHYIFSTKRREKLILPKYEKRIWQFMGGIAKQNGVVPYAIGGIEDHVHLLISLPKTLSVAQAIQLIKGGSSSWIHSTFSELKNFAWQEGYGAFSVSYSKLEKVKTYIENQKEHHRQRSFKEEYLEFLKKYNIPYDERYIWD
ncbi:IS200/IS605 family transposase [Calditrichota bacterium LG25]